MSPAEAATNMKQFHEHNSGNSSGSRQLIYSWTLMMEAGVHLMFVIWSSKLSVL